VWRLRMRYAQSDFLGLVLQKSGRLISIYGAGAGYVDMNACACMQAYACHCTYARMQLHARLNARMRICAHLSSRWSNSVSSCSHRNWKLYHRTFWGQRGPRGSRAGVGSRQGVCKIK
jgi:hypothetical protein